MNNQKTGKMVLFVVIAQLCAITTLAGAFALGLILKENFNNGVVLACLIASLSILVAALIINIVLKAKATKKYREMKVKEANDFMLKRKEDIKTHFEEATKKLHRVSFFCKIYVIALVVFLHIATFFMGAYISTFTPLLIFSYFFIAGIYIHIAGAILNKPKLEIQEYLQREDFPYLYSIADKAMKETGIDAPIYVCTERSFDGSIGKYGNKYLVNLGSSLVNCLTYDELYNVLLHEFAHVSDKYTPKSVHGFFHRFIEFDGNNFFTIITDTIIAYPIIKYATEYLFYTMLASEYIEAMADSIVTKKGNPKAFASALAKCNLHSSYERVQFLYNSPIFEAEKPRDMLASECLEGFLLALKDNMGKWLDCYEKEIQPRNASHPIYRLRRKAVGVLAEDVKISFEITDEALKNEAKKLLDFTNKMLIKNLSPHYEESRKNYYLTPLSCVEKWEKNKSNYMTEDLNVVIDSLAELNRHKEAEALCDEIIATEENVYATAYAKFFKGFMLSNYDDLRCIDLLYEVIELNSNYVQPCLEFIGQFACRNGLQKELDTYREKAISLSQKFVDEDEKASSISHKDTLVKDTMEADILKEHIDFILSTSNNIKSVYLVRKIISETFYSRVFLIEFERKTEFSQIQESMDKIFRHLDCFDNELYSLFLLTDYNRRLVKKVDGSLVYSK